MKQVEVSILGQVYMLGCPEGGETLLTAAVASVDKEMTTIRDSGKVRARERIAVLAALNLAYQLAERGAVPPPAAATPATPAQGTPESDAALDALLRRVDAVLADDGQLL
ncbi:MAG: cell division protein ZapA [Rubrivivax sp.]|nr:cell division protein ZapA [Rubrivivax sp.]